MVYDDENLNHHSNLQTIIGLGKTGLSCARFLTAHGWPIAVTDSRAEPPGLAEWKAYFPHAPTVLGKISLALSLAAARLVVSPGVPLTHPVLAQAMAQGIPVVGDIELFAQQVTAPVVAITGSNGKSTVTTLIAEMAKAAHLSVAAGGNLGTPALDLLSMPAALYSLELSSFQLETTYSLRSKAAVVLNVSEDHMDRYPNLQAYLQAKQRIYQGCEAAVVNRDQPEIWSDLELPNRLSFGLSQADFPHFGWQEKDGRGYLCQGDQLLLPESALKIKGRHQVSNALAALALGTHLGFPMKTMLATLSDFSGLPHRCQWVGAWDGISWYNDSKATNVGAAKAAIEGIGASIPGKLIVIAGGQGKQADFSPLRGPMQAYVRHAILLGQDGPLMEEALKGSTEITPVSDLTSAVQIAKQSACVGDAVILCPACASFDMFDGFEHRGLMFEKAVKAFHSRVER